MLGAAWRDAAFFATHGRAGRYHVVLDGRGARPERTMSACGQPSVGVGPSGISELMSLADVPEVLRCQRRGCRERWPRGGTS